MFVITENIMKRPVYISEDIPLLTKFKVRQFPKRRVVGGGE